MSKMIQSSKSPVCKPQSPPSPKFIPNLNHVGSSSNFLDIFLIIYRHDSWFQRWPHPPSLQSGTLNVLQVPNEASQLNHNRSSSNFQDIFLIIYWYDSWFKRWPHTWSLQSGTLNVLQVPNEASQLNHDGSSSNFQDIFLIIYQHHLWCQRWPNPSSLQSGTINIIQSPIWSKTKFKPIFSWAKLVLKYNQFCFPHWDITQCPLPLHSSHF